MICDEILNKKKQIKGHHKYQNIPFSYSKTFSEYLFHHNKIQNVRQNFKLCAAVSPT